MLYASNDTIVQTVTPDHSTTTRHELVLVHDEDGAERWYEYTNILGGEDRLRVLRELGVIDAECDPWAICKFNGHTFETLGNSPVLRKRVLQRVNAELKLNLRMLADF